MKKNEIRDILNKADKELYSHVIIKCDKFDYEYYPVFVKRGKNVREALENDLDSMTSIMEVYNLDLDIESQLNEKRSYHIEEAKGVENKNDPKKITSITKDEMKTLLRLADKDNYKEIIIYSDEDETEIHIYYVKIYDRSISSISKEIVEKGYKILMYYPLDKFQKWNKEDEKRFLHEYGYSKVNKALEFAREKHKGQMRKGKNPREYIVHPIGVAKLIEKYKGNSHKIDDLICAAYLHDTIEDTDTTYYELVDNFGGLVASLVYELTTDKNMKNEMGKPKYLAFKMQGMTEWALDIKLCDKLYNICDLDDVTSEFRENCINETIFIINYLINNRKLNATQNRIIKDILNQINNLVPNNSDGKKYSMQTTEIK